jgi:uncharacterized membrane protein YdjX (TVP38/TMEM64 family)
MSEGSEHSSAAWKVWILPALVVLGLALAAWQPIGMEALLHWGERIGTNWWFLALVMVAIAVLFTFGLPGSFGLWLVAPFNPPVLSTILLVIASTAGALGAYRFAGHLGKDWKPSGASGKVVDVLEQRGDMLTLMAMRMLPGFPHSVINFASGVLRLPLAAFVAATVMGLVIKWGVYASAIHGIADAVEAGDAINLGTIVPLFVLVALTLLGAWARRRLTAGVQRGD